MRAGYPFKPAKITTEVQSMKIGFICPNVPGHLNPMTALARQLEARNHEVVFLYSAGAAGLPFVPSPEKDHITESRPVFDISNRFAVSIPTGRKVQPYSRATL